MPKKYIGISTLDAARIRTREIFEFFPRVYLSFSGGKDSTVMLHLAAEEARRVGRKFGVLIIDLEAQYKLTIEHIDAMITEYADVIELYWVCLPIALRNSVSVYEPKWECFDPDKKDIWVRKPNSKCITDEKFFPFFKRGMEFEEFVPEFGKWYSQGQPTAVMIGIRTDESYNRYLKLVVGHNREFFGGRRWALKQKSTGMEIYSCHPIYDMSTKDIWVFHAKFKDKRHNHLYDLMHQAGLSIHQQRICQPYGDDQRKGLWLYHVIEPETWAKVVARVNGANSGAEFVKYSGNTSGQVKITKPEGHTWQSFCTMLLGSMPDSIAEHYRDKIFVFLRHYEEHGYRNGIPDESDPKLEATKKAPSWRRIAKMLLRNDYWAKTIGFVPNKTGSYLLERYKKRISEERKKRRAENIDRYGVKL